MKNVREILVGRITLAVTLILVGVGLLVVNLIGCPVVGFSLPRMWPVIVLGFGAELMYRTRQAERARYPVRVRVDMLSVVVLLVVIASVNIPLVLRWRGFTPIPIPSVPRIPRIPRPPRIW